MTCSPSPISPMDCHKLGFPVLHYHPEFAQTYVHWACDTIQPLHLLLPPCPPAFNLYQHQGPFKWVGPSHEVAKVWSFSFSISPFNEYSGLISFRIDWLDLLAVQGTLKSLLRHRNSKASVLRCSAFFMAQLSHPYIHDYWKKHSFDYKDLCQQSDVSAF